VGEYSVGGAMKRYHYQYTLEEFMSPSVRGSFRDYNDISWYGNQTHEQVVNGAINGDDSLVPYAEKLIEQLDTTVDIEHAEWIPSIYGAYPIVPEFLAGSVTPMRHKTRVPSDTTPIGVWVDLTPSCGVDAKTLERKGATILALVMKLQQVRAVELHCCGLAPSDVEGGYFIDILMPTQPLQLSVVCHVLTCAGFIRDLVFGHKMRECNQAGWWGRVIREEEEFRSAASIPEGDLAIVGSHLQDYESLRDNVRWVQDQVNKYVHKEEE